MRRSRVAVLAAAVVVGVATGAAAHTVSDPFADRVPGPADTASGSPTSNSTPSVSPTPTRGATSAPRTSEPLPSPTPSPTPRAPAFTPLALLQPEQFVAHGWEVARTVETFDRIPVTTITPCTTVAPDRDDLVAGYAATYASERTTAAEVVARFDSEEAAEDAYQRLRVQIAGCTNSSAGRESVRVTDSHQPDSDGVAELRWWNFRPLGDGPTRGAIGVVRAQDRVALLSLRSDLRDPADTTDISGLLNLAGRRLV